MWMTSIIDRYRKRPDGDMFEVMCMATFALEYCVLPKNETSPKHHQIELKNNLRFILRRTQTQFAVVWYMRFSLEKQQEGHLLQLFLHCRTDLDLKPEGFELFKQFYEADENRAKFEINCPDLEHAQEHAVKQC